MKSRFYNMFKHKFRRLKDSFYRWKYYIINFKHVYNRLELLERNVTNIILREQFHHAEDLEQRRLLNIVEAKVRSQNGEDGILSFLLQQIGVKNKYIVEIGIGNGKECNSANLILNSEWNGLLIDGSKEGVMNAINFLKSNTAKNQDISIQHHWVTKDNIDQIIKNSRVPHDPDILSIDIDGNDYWIWKAIGGIKPRIVVIEYNASLGWERAITVKYDEDFNRFDKQSSGWYHGASLAALTKLGKEKQYSLVGCDSNGVNAFFVRNDLLISISTLRALKESDAFYPIRKRLLLADESEQFELIKHLEFVKV